MKTINQRSRFLSLVLRHQPEKAGLTLTDSGWTSVTDVLSGVGLSMVELEEVVATNDKKRFEFNDDKTLIRARQGHSVKVDLGYESATPPTILYHGTAEKNRELILRHGLNKMQRHHVHLSADEDTAVAVGRRHGSPVLFVVRAGEMVLHGWDFYKTANGVWLVDRVPSAFVRLLARP
jgi:putative RNA 2'-phosphotransferase